METFPQYHQLQKNVLLTICNDRFLQEVNFDKYRCARLVMDCLCNWHDNSMNRMSVAICSILGKYFVKDS
jgi:Zyg-11 family protein